MREGYSAAAPDLSSLVTKLKRAGADVISHAGYNGRGLSSTQARELAAVLLEAADELDGWIESSQAASRNRIALVRV